MIALKWWHIYIVAAVTLVLLVALVTYVVLGKRPPVHSVEVDIDEDVLPGHELPRGAYCQWQYFLGEETVNCNAVTAEGFVGLSYDPHKHQILRTYYGPNNKFSVGELILTRGAPVRISKKGAWIYLYWRDGSATFSYAKVFRPGTPVLLVIYGNDLMTDDAQQWQGFANGR
jgi:hypothetical protein